MQRIQALSPSATPAMSQSMLDAVQKQLGMVPNVFRTMAHSPAVLRFYLAGSEALATGALPAALREQIALVAAGENECDYCASAHTLMGKGAGISASEMAGNLRCRAENSKTQAALDFAKLIVRNRGRVTDAQLVAVRAADYTEAEVVEMIAHVAVNIFTNYFNHIAGTVVDFPLVNAAATTKA